MSIITVFHQLHCLYTVRRAYFAVNDELEDFDFGHERTEHVKHCFEYLRQTLLCTADSTVEPASSMVDNHLSEGRDAPRQCKDFAELRHWTEDRRMFEGHGFLAKDARKGGDALHGH